MCCKPHMTVCWLCWHAGVVVPEAEYFVDGTIIWDSPVCDALLDNINTVGGLDADAASPGTLLDLMRADFPKLNRLAIKNRLAKLRSLAEKEANQQPPASAANVPTAVGHALQAAPPLAAPAPGAAPPATSNGQQQAASSRKQRATRTLAACVLAGGLAPQPASLMAASTPVPHPPAAGSGQPAAAGNNGRQQKLARLMAGGLHSWWAESLVRG